MRIRGSAVSPGPDDDPDWDIAERWARKPLSAKKEVLRLLRTPEHLGALYLMPCPTRGHGVWAQPLSDRVEYRDADGQPRYREPSGRELAARKPGDPAPECRRRP